MPCDLWCGALAAGQLLIAEKGWPQGWIFIMRYLINYFQQSLTLVLLVYNLPYPQPQRSESNLCSACCSPPLTILALPCRPHLIKSHGWFNGSPAEHPEDFCLTFCVCKEFPASVLDMVVGWVSRKPRRAPSPKGSSSSLSPWMMWSSLMLLFQVCINFMSLQVHHSVRTSMCDHLVQVSSVSTDLKPRGKDLKSLRFMYR